MNVRPFHPLYTALARLVCLAALASAAIGLVACGGSSGSEATGASDSGSDSSQERARLRLTECLRKQGVDVPSDNGAGGGGRPPANFDRQKLRDAIQGPCKKYQRGAFGNLSRQDQTELRDRLTKFTACMRKNGADVPDMQPGQGPPPAINRNDPTFQKALEACQSQAPRRGPGGPGGPGAPGGPGQ
jgi:hypothetical protein